VYAPAEECQRRSTVKSGADRSGRSAVRTEGCCGVVWEGSEKARPKMPSMCGSEVREVEAERADSRVALGRVRVARERVSW
jgi:hypothetical protein